MAFVLLIAGIGFLFVGLLAVGFGIPINEFSFGNTLILAGSITACTGMILIGLWAVVRELTGIARGLGPALASARPSSTASAISREPAPASEGFLSGGAQSVAETPVEGEASSAAFSLPWQDEAAARDRGRSEATSAPVEEPAPPKRRNLMFSSSSRKERERERSRDESANPSEAALDGVPGDLPQPATFEDAWPQPERSRAEAPPRRVSRTPSTFTEPAVSADRYPPAASREETPVVSVLKSGVVDGMAYSLYSDGSIEAQMPEGMMRFASIDELRSHLDQRP